MLTNAQLKYGYATDRIVSHNYLLIVFQVAYIGHTCIQRKRPVAQHIPTLQGRSAGGYRGVQGRSAEFMEILTNNGDEKTLGGQSSSMATSQRWFNSKFFGSAPLS